MAENAGMLLWIWVLATGLVALFKIGDVNDILLGNDGSDHGHGPIQKASKTPKAEEIRGDPKVVFTFQSSNQFATVAGQAELVRDRALIDTWWSEEWEVWFPCGQERSRYLFDSRPSLQGEYWDERWSPRSGMRLAREIC